MAWKKINGDGSEHKPEDNREILKWQEGLAIEGRVKAMRTNKYGPLMDFENKGGEVTTFGVPTVLGTELSKVPAGALIRIECRGKVMFKSGNRGWVFNVFVDE